MRCHAAGAEQQVLHAGRVDVDAAHDQHVVEAAAQPGQPDRGAAALARGVGQAPDVAGPVAQQRQRLLGQRGEDELAFGSRRHGAPAGVDHLDDEVVLLHVQPGAGRALGRHPGPAHLGQAVEVDRTQRQRLLDLPAHGLGPRLAAEQPEPHRQRSGAPVPVLGQGLRDRQRVRRRRDQDVGAEVAQQHRLPGGEAAGHRDHRCPDPLSALVEAEAAGEQPVAVGVVDHHAGPDAGHRHAPRHQLGPRLQVAPGVADNGGLAVAAARRLHPDELLPLHRQQAERIARPQVGLGSKRDPGQVGQGADVTGGRDPGGRQPLGAGRLAVQHPRDRRAQAAQLQLLELLAGQRLRAVPDHLVGVCRATAALRGCARAHSSAPPGCGRAPG